MDARTNEELARLAREGERHADAARRSWSFTLQVTVATAAFALCVLIPKAGHLFGHLTIGQAVFIQLPGILAIYVSVAMYRLRGPDSFAYQVADGIESFLLYTQVLLYIVASGSAASPIWILPPFTSTFWATLKPFVVWRYRIIIVLAHGVMAAAFLATHQGSDAVVAVAGGALCLLLHAAVSRSARGNLLLQAERNVLRTRLSDALLDGERQRIEGELNREVGREIRAISEELEQLSGLRTATDGAGVVAQAQDVLLELEAVTWALWTDDAPRGIDELARLVERKCRPLVAHAEYRQTSRCTVASSRISSRVAWAGLRVAQEWVRNAVVHGRATVVHVDLALAESLTLSVRDDGVGLTEDALRLSAGGLGNARAWVHELGGVIELAPPSGTSGTELRMTVPTTN